MILAHFRSYLKINFWPGPGVGATIEILDILEYAYGLN
jgi:hypothetical protein